MKEDTTSQAFFERKYLDKTDPWFFASSRYEQDRYAAIVNALSHRRYRRAFEPGCSIGMLTARLASLCGNVEAMDISPTAVGRARENCRRLPNVEIVCERLPMFVPTGSFDLVVLSEIGYYFDEEQLAATLKTVIAKIDRAGVLLATHWLGTSADHLLSGDRVHEIIGSLNGLSHEHAERHADFRLDRWQIT
jgi:SAM-dependent methyltransferase